MSRQTEVTQELSRTGASCLRSPVTAKTRSFRFSRFSHASGNFFSAPLSEAELDSYEELYPFLPPVPPASDIKDNNEAPEDTSGITG